jgi:hypothetical protein
MDKYIPTDLVKYIISDYIAYKILVVIDNSNYIINPNRIKITNTKLTINNDTTITKFIDNDIFKVKTYNDINNLICTQTYSKGILKSEILYHDLCNQIINKSYYDDTGKLIIDKHYEYHKDGTIRIHTAYYENGDFISGNIYNPYELLNDWTYKFDIN